MQYPSIAGQPESCTADQTSEDSKEDDASTQVTKRQYPDVGVKYETFIVDQTSNNDSKGNDFSTQMNKLPAFSDSLYDSSDDGSEGLSTSNSEVASQRPRRGCSNPRAPSSLRRSARFSWHWKRNILGNSKGRVWTKFTLIQMTLLMWRWYLKKIWKIPSCQMNRGQNKNSV
ncbi:uncharacterized protein LOC133483175 isoform X2 [Phyllopteryx taeniolatus]|uniref:uncharacterized protein LOC133483175 isoform X2 n=1 Tax=Phyllopteryx taeniolatus TaxID=161469 RepID=UPI002AD21E8B|nr:uncharacterized protein LOC133483175 isoform X2 [Phyllopteryx taeniolatus]